MTGTDVRQHRVRWAENGLGQAVLAYHFLSNEAGLREAVRMERRRLLWVQLGGVFLVPLVGALLATHTDSLAFAGVVGCAAWALWAVGALSTLGPWRRAHADLDRKSRGRSNPEPIAIEGWLDAEGLVLEWRTSRVLYKWSAFDRVERIEAYIAFLTPDDLTGITIPASAFASEADATRFIAEATDGMLRAGTHESQTVPKLLAESNLPCLSCGQSLQGLRDARCPECGEVITSRSIRIRHTLHRKRVR